MWWHRHQQEAKELLAIERAEELRVIEVRRRREAMRSADEAPQAVDEAQRAATVAEFLAWQQRAQQAAVEVLEERTMLWWHRHMQDWSARIDALGKVASSVESESAAESAS